MTQHPLELPPEVLRKVCDENELTFDTTIEIVPVDRTVGQDRAIQSLEFGLSIRTHGHNIYVSGVPGTGRGTTVMSTIEALAKGLPPSGDWCYVYNFRDPYHPSAFGLPPGMGSQLADDMKTLVEAARREIGRLFQSEGYQQRRQQIISEMERRRDVLFRELDVAGRQRGLTVQFSPAGIMTVPLHEDRAITPEEYQQLPEDQREQLRDAGEAFNEHLVTFMNRVRELEQAASDALRELDRQGAIFAVGHLVEQLEQKYAAFPQIVSYLTSVQTDMIENLQDFREERDGQPPASGGQGQFPVQLSQVKDTFGRYQVNVLVDNREPTGAPVVMELNPTYYNLMGRIEFQPALGTLQTNFRTIKPGALHRANGGYLVLQAKDVLSHPFSWDALKRALDCSEIVIENIGEMTSLIPTVSLRPDPIPLNVKVVIIGNPMLYNLLYHMDEDFRKQFKVKADFDIEMDRTPENVTVYAGFVRARVDQDKLLHFHRSAVAKVVEFGSRLLEDQEKLATRFIEIGDLAAESSYWAQQAGSNLVMREHVEKAEREKDFRSSLVREKVQEVIRQNIIKIDTEGSAIGQINGLSVMDIGDFLFGTPSRITAEVSMGADGIINVEREIEMSGRIHSKGVLVLSGYLKGRFAREFPLSLSASLTFEQLYNDVDGDSASSTELYCILSALAEVPLRQDIAVTGSVNQRGDIQAVGGVQYKIEGFYDVCKQRGLTGSQGVIIPRSNVRHLMLKDDVVDAVRAGRFHVYAIDTVEEGIELLTGVPAGSRQPDGAYPEGTVFEKVRARLEENADRLREYGRPLVEELTEGT